MVAVTAVDTSNLIGNGMYTPAEAARYARVGTALFSRWIFGNSVGDAVIIRQHQNERLVSFLDLVQTLAIRRIRLEYSIPLNTIRDAVNHAHTRYGIDFPFARKHKTLIFGKSIAIEIGDKLIEISGKNKDQLHKTVIEPYIRDLTFDSTGLATTYSPFKWNNNEIIMDPKFHFGQPVLKSCGYSYSVLYHAVKTEGSYEAAAAAYAVSVDEIDIACRYYDFLAGTKGTRRTNIKPTRS